MPIDYYIQLKDYQNDAVKDDDGASWIPLRSFSFDVEQTLNLGSQSTGVGAGKVAFNPLSITLVASRSLATTLFKHCASGVAFKQMEIAGYRAGEKGSLVDDYVFSLVAVRTQSFSHDGEQASMTITFEYGGLRITHYTTDAKGKASALPLTVGWNRVRNTLMGDKSKDKDMESTPVAPLILPERTIMGGFA